MQSVLNTVLLQQHVSGQWYCNSAIHCGRWSELSGAASMENLASTDTRPLSLVKNWTVFSCYCVYCWAPQVAQSSALNLFVCWQPYNIHAWDTVLKWQAGFSLVCCRLIVRKSGFLSNKVWDSEEWQKWFKPPPVTLVSGFMRAEQMSVCCSCGRCVWVCVCTCKYV